MKENKSTYAVFQIGLGILCLIIASGGFIMSIRRILVLEAVFLGIGLLLSGLANHNKDTSERRKILSRIGSVFYILGAGLIFYNTFFNS